MADKEKSEMDTGSDDLEMDKDTTTTDDGNDGDAVRAELEDTRKALKKANREAADRRRKLEQYEKEDNERREAELSEIEKVTAKLEKAVEKQAAAESKLALKLQHDAFFGTASDGGLVWASEQARRDVVRLLDWDDVDAESMPDLLKEIKADRPYLFKSPHLPEIDGKKKTTVTKAEADEADIETAARRYGVPYAP